MLAHCGPTEAENRQLEMEWKIGCWFSGCRRNRNGNTEERGGRERVLARREETEMELLKRTYNFTALFCFYVYCLFTSVSIAGETRGAGQLREMGHSSSNNKMAPGALLPSWSQPPIFLFKVEGGKTGNKT